MSFSESAANIMGRVFDNGLDEVLIFAFVFIFILLSGEGSDFDKDAGILPLVVIGVFLLLFSSFGRLESDSGI